MRYAFPALVLTAALPVGAQEAPPRVNLFPYEDPVAVAAGEAIYAAECASCHGADLEGQGDWRAPGPDGRALAPPHDETGHTWHHPDPQLFLLTKYGPAALIGNGYESNMPAFEGRLTDTEILEVLAFIKSTWPEEIRRMHTERNLELEQSGG